MARKTVKAPATAVKVPQSSLEAAEFVARIGQLQRARQSIAVAMNETIEAAKAIAESRARPHGEEITQLVQGLEVWAAANRTALTEGGKRKTAVLSTGELRWRTTPPAVSLKKVKAVIAALRARGLKRFLRTKTEVDKEAILKEPAAIAGIPGISIGQREEFVIVPNETQLEEVRT